MESKPGGELTGEKLASIEDEEVLNKMLDGASDFEERRMIRAALRNLLKKKRDKREEERGMRQQDLKQQGVDIQNFSSSWKDGIAFCALVHRFFPDAFEYSTLNPNKPKDNFQLAFGAAERLAGCPPLLDADDLVRMKEPDWKCVYTYIQEFYRCLVEKGLVKTKKR
uniref:Smoothelin a n=2 Tax=Nothobranchius TaxID=28779 RepID=A0A1A8P543_9TELE